MSVAVPSVVLAQADWTVGNRLTLPQAGSAPRGFTVEIVGENMHRFGDMPLRVIVSPTGPTFREDRQVDFRVAFDPSTVEPRSRSTSYQFTIELPAGSGPVSKTVYLPKWVLGGALEASVLEQGQLVTGYRGQLVSRGQGRYVDALKIAWMESAQNSFCWIADPGSVPLARASGSQAADLRVLLATLSPELLVIEPLTSPETTVSLLKQHGQAVGLDYRTVQEVPEDWQGFNQYHVWITRWSTYRWLVENRPDSERALRQFIRCGGALWLLDADDDQAITSHLRTIWGPQWFGEPAKDAGASSRVPFADQSGGAGLAGTLDIAAYLQRNYLLDSHLTVRRPLLDQAYQRFQGDPEERVLLDANLDWLKQWPGNLRQDDIFTLRLGVGLIIGCRSQEGVPGSYLQWKRMLDQSQEHASSVLTRGVDPIAGNARFWNWVIPGVAQPPVYGLIGLLTLFVIMVGPVAYRKLNRMGRGYLMFFVAPILAAVTTLFLFGYGLIADGLGTQGRVRQITWVCDRDGGAMRYWRSTYFAGLRPAEGLRFPIGTRLEPFYLNEFASWQEMSSGEGMLLGTMTLGEQSLQLSSGFLPSRQQRQFVAYRPLEQAGALVWVDAQGVGAPTVRNEFDYPLREVVLCAADGQYWGADVVAAGGTATPVLLEASAASRRLTDLYLRNRLEPPDGVIRVRRRNVGPMDLISVLANMEPWRDTAAGQRAAGADGVIEGWLQHTLQTTSALRQGTFIALSDVTDDCVAVKSASLVESIHYVIGELR